jgi:hypothetical protein
VLQTSVDISNKYNFLKLKISPTGMENMPPEKITDIGYIHRCTQGCDHLDISGPQRLLFYPELYWMNLKIVGF